MATGWLVACIVAISSLVQLAHGRAFTSPPPAPTLLPRLNSTAADGACARASSASSSFLAAHPTGKPVSFPSDLHLCSPSAPSDRHPDRRRAGL